MKLAAHGRTSKRGTSVVLHASARERLPTSGSPFHRHFELMHRTSNHYVGSRVVWHPTARMSSDWLFQEADALESQKRSLPGRAAQTSERFHSLSRVKSTEGVRLTNDFNAAEFEALMPCLSLSSGSKFVQIGRHLRGKLLMDLSLNYEDIELVGLSNELPQLVQAARTCEPVVKSGLMRSSVNFIGADPQHWHYKSTTHVLLHNDGAGIDPTTCRAIVSKLAALPTFKLLATTTPLPFQHHLVHVGETVLGAKPQGFSLQHQGQAGPEGGLRTAQPKPTTIHLYSKSFDTVPVGTLAALYCNAGVCCLPAHTYIASPAKAAAHAAQAALSQPSPKASGLESPMATTESASLSRSSSQLPSWAPLPPLAACTSAYLDGYTSDASASSA